MKILLTALLVVLVFGCKGNYVGDIIYASLNPMYRQLSESTFQILWATPIDDTIRIIYIDTTSPITNIAPNPKPSPLPDTTKPIRKKIDSTGIVLAKALGFPEYNGQFVNLFDKKGKIVNYYDSAGWMIKDTYTNKTMPDRYSPKTIDSIVKNSESPFEEKKPIKDKIKMQPRWRDSTSIILTDLGNKPAKDIGAVDTIIYEGTGTDWVLDVQPIPYYKNDSTWNNNDTTKAILLVSDTSSVNGFRSSRCWWMEGYETMCSRLEKLSNSRCLDKNDKPTTDCWIEIVETCYLDQSKIPLKKNIIVWLSKEVKP